MGDLWQLSPIQQPQLAAEADDDDGEAALPAAWLTPRPTPASVNASAGAPRDRTALLSPARLAAAVSAARAATAQRPSTPLFLSPPEGGEAHYF